PPQNTLINGLPTNILGIVGTAQWGPVNAPTTIGDMTGYAQTFGAVQNRKYDMGTQVALAVLQGANNFKCVR
ncbi:phage tail protein, partial [Salmonella enterica]